MQGVQGEVVAGWEVAKGKKDLQQLIDATPCEDTRVTGTLKQVSRMILER